MLTIKNFRYINQKALWKETNNPKYPFEANIKGKHWRLRINDFPEQHLYTFFVNDLEIFDIDDPPPTWIIPKSEKRGRVK